MQINSILAYLHKIGFTSNNFFKALENGFFNDFSLENFLLEKNMKIFGMKEEKIKKVLKDYSEKDFEKLEKYILENEIEIISFLDENYPEKLKNIFSKPFLIYKKGKISLEKKGIAIVGSRKISNYSVKNIKDFVLGLGKYFTIISGGALGADIISHKEALQNNFETIAVLGTGIDIFYPAENRKILEEIAKVGAVISIFPIGTEASKYTFPIRNEIVSGLSESVLIVEAALKSGSLITAKVGLEQGKEVFAIPGDISRENSLGTNSIIQSGEAYLVQNYKDILDYFSIKESSNSIEKEINFENELQEKIYNLLKYESLTIDEIAKNLNLDISLISSELSLMEIYGIIKSDNGKYFLL